MPTENSPPSAGKPRTLENESDLDELVRTRSPVLVEFYTDGCGICGSMEPVLTAVARESEAVVATVNPRDDPPLIDRFQVQSVPLFVLFVDGEPVARLADGFVPVAELLSWIETEL